MRLRTLGNLALEGSVLRRPKPLLLLAYLAIEGRRARSHLAELFWPTATDARNRLSVTLRRLRADAPGTLEADATHVAARVPCDAVDLRHAVARGEAEEALAAYAGAFLDGFDLDVGVELEEWLYATREVLADDVRQLVVLRATTLADHGDGERAAALAEIAATLPGASAPDRALHARLAGLLDGGDVDRTWRLRRLDPDAGVDLVRTSSDVAATRSVADVPTRRTSFVGRARELAGVADLFERVGARLVTLHGPGGAGKTRLALEVARERARTPGVDAVHVISLFAVASPDALMSTLADALGAPAQHDRDPLRATVDALGDRHVVLVLDEAEHLVDGAPVLGTLLDACPGLRLLVTSRRRLDLQPEYVWRLGGLALPDEATASRALETGDVASLAGTDAVSLFLHRARQARADLAWRPEDVHAAWRVCRAVGGLPLAIELSAVWVRAMPVSAIEAAVASSLDALATPARDALPRHRTMRAVLDRSWSLLDDHGRRALARLSVFRDGFDAEAAQVAADADVEAEAHGRHVDAMTRLAERAAPHVTGRDQVDWFDRLEVDAPNLLAALAHAERHDVHTCVRLAYRLERFWTVRQRQAEVATVMARALTHAEPVLDGAERAQALYLVASADHDEPAAEAPAREALALAQALRDAPLTASLTLFWGNLAQRLGNTEEAEDALRDALERFRALADAAGEAAALKGLGTVFYRRGDEPTAERWWQASLAVETAIGNVSGMASRTYNLGLIAKRRGDLEVALALQRRALVHHHRLRDPLACVHGVEALACIAGVAGKPLRAAHLWGAVTAEREARSLERLPDAQAAFLEDSAEARAQVDGPRFEAAWARGRREGFAAIVEEELRREAADPNATAPGPGIDTADATALDRPA